MNNVRYNLNLQRRQTTPVKLSPTNITNLSDSKENTHIVAETKSFTFGQSIELGISLEITAGTTLIDIETTTTLSVTSTSTFETGSSTEKTHSDTIEAEIKLPAMSKS